MCIKLKTKFILQKLRLLFFKDRSRNSTIALVLSFIITLLICYKTDKITYNHSLFPMPWDHHKYIFMALNNLDFHIAPFCWRILVPILASILPFELSINFQLIAFFSIAFSGYFVFLIGRKIFENDVIGFGMILAFYTFSFAVKYPIHDFWLPDALVIFLISAGIYSILIKNNLTFLLIIVLGALTKESVLFIIPLYYTLNTEQIFDKKLLFRTFVFLIIGLSVLILVRVLIPPLNHNHEYISKLPLHLKLVQNESSFYSFGYLFKTIGLERIKNFSLKFLYKISVYVFTSYSIFMFFDIKSLLKWSIKFLPYLIFVYSQLLFAINIERLVVLAFPFVLISAFAGLNKVGEKITYPSHFIILMNLIYLIFDIQSGLIYGNWLIINRILLFILLLNLFKLTVRFKHIF